jgi:hypothetical protein
LKLVPQRKGLPVGTRIDEIRLVSAERVDGNGGLVAVSAGKKHLVHTGDAIGVDGVKERRKGKALVPTYAPLVRLENAYLDGRNQPRHLLYGERFKRASAQLEGERLSPRTPYKSKEQKESRA